MRHAGGMGGGMHGSLAGHHASFAGGPVHVGGSVHMGRPVGGPVHMGGPVRVGGPAFHAGFRAPLYRPLLYRPYRTAFRPYMGVWPRWGPAWYAGVWYGGLYGPYGPGCPLYGYSPSGLYYGDQCDPMLIASAPGSGVVVVQQPLQQAQPQVTVVQSAAVAPGAIVSERDVFDGRDDACDCCDACCYGCDCECLWCCLPRSKSHRAWARRRHVSCAVALAVVVWVVFWCVFAFAVAGSQHTRNDYALEEGEMRLFPLATSDPLWATELRLADRSGAQAVQWFVSESLTSPVILPPSTSAANGVIAGVSTDASIGVIKSSAQTCARPPRTGFHGPAPGVAAHRTRLSGRVPRSATITPTPISVATLKPMSQGTMSQGTISVSYPISGLTYSAYDAYGFYLASSSVVSATIAFSAAVDVIVIIGDDAYAYWAQTGDRSVVYAAYNQRTQWTGSFVASSTEAVYWAVESNYVSGAISGTFSFDIQFASYDTSAMSACGTGTCTVGGSRGRNVKWAVARAPSIPFNGYDLYDISISREMAGAYRAGPAVAILFGVAVGLMVLAVVLTRCCEVYGDEAEHLRVSLKPHAAHDPVLAAPPPPVAAASAASVAPTQSATPTPAPAPTQYAAPQSQALSGPAPTIGHTSVQAVEYPPPVVIAVSREREGDGMPGVRPNPPLPGATDASASVLLAPTPLVPLRLGPESEPVSIVPVAAAPPSPDAQPPAYQL